MVRMKKLIREQELVELDKKTLLSAYEKFLAMMIKNESRHDSFFDGLLDSIGRSDVAYLTREQVDMLKRAKVNVTVTR